MNKRSLVGISVAGCGALGMLFVLAAPTSKLPIDAANGAYRHACCETMTLKDGQMFFGDHKATYVIETDKVGAYVLPDRYVGVQVPVGIYADRSRHPLELRLDAPANPQTIALYGGRRVFSFER